MAPEKAVWVLDPDNKPQRVVLTTGETDGTNTEVLTGNLKDGDNTITAVLATAAPASGGSPVSQTGARGGRGPGF